MKMRKKIAVNSMIILFRQLAAASRSRLPFDELMKILLKDDSVFGKDLKTMERLAEALTKGAALSASLEAASGILPGETIGLIKAAEESGNVANVLDALADDFVDRSQMSVSIREALSWPIIILSIVAIILCMVMVFVIPSFKELFSNYGADLPAPTLVLIAISELATNLFVPTIGVIAISAIFLRFRGTPGWLSGLLGKFAMAIPFVRKYAIQAFSTRLVNWARATYRHPQAFAQAIRHMRATDSYGAFRNCLQTLESRLGASSPIYAALYDLKPLSNRYSILLELGEKNGDSEAALAGLSDLADSERMLALSRFERMFIVTTYIALALSVGLVVIGLYLPIFKMGSVIG